MEIKRIHSREQAMQRIRMAKERKAKAVEEMKSILTEICIKETGKAPTSFEVL